VKNGDNGGGRGVSGSSDGFDVGSGNNDGSGDSKGDGDGDRGNNKSNSNSGGGDSDSSKKYNNQLKAAVEKVATMAAAEALVAEAMVLTSVAMRGGGGYGDPRWLWRAAACGNARHGVGRR
jgi:hypothetical protein